MRRGPVKPRSRLEWLADAATIVMALCGVVLVSARISHQGRSRTPSPTVDGSREIPEWRTLAADGQRIGPPDAPVRIVEFGDYGCPFCRREEEALRALRRAYPTQVAVVYHYLPLDIHPDAYQGARLANCAADQGDFEAVHDLLYSAITLHGLDPAEVAREGHISDLKAYVGCAGKTDPVPRIEADIQTAGRLDIVAVPAVIFQGTLLHPPPDSATLFRKTEEALKR